ncbi:MAG: hypothetical protein RL077_2011 [Verrucomicrobiota bacterium]
MKARPLDSILGDFDFIKIRVFDPNHLPTGKSDRCAAAKAIPSLRDLLARGWRTSAGPSFARRSSRNLDIHENAEVNDGAARSRSSRDSIKRRMTGEETPETIRRARIPCAAEARMTIDKNLPQSARRKKNHSLGPE